VSTSGERKCALLLLTLRRSDRRRLLRRLPATSATAIRALIAELEALPLPVAELAETLLADEVMGLTGDTAPALDQLVALSRQLSPAWFARVLSVWGGVDRAFCLAMLDEKTAAAVRREGSEPIALPPRLADAMRAEAMALTQQQAEAA
jgi:hypothetical protein